MFSMSDSPVHEHASSQARLEATTSFQLTSPSWEPSYEWLNEEPSLKRAKKEPESSSIYSSKDHLMFSLEVQSSTAYLIGFKQSFDAPLFYIENGNDAPTLIAPDMLPEQHNHYDYKLQWTKKLADDGTSVVSATLEEFLAFYKHAMFEDPILDVPAVPKVLTRIRCEDQEAWLTYDKQDGVWGFKALADKGDGTFLEMTPAQFETRCNSHSKKWRQSFKMMGIVKNSKFNNLMPATAEQFMAFMKRMLPTRQPTDGLVGPPSNLSSSGTLTPEGTAAAAVDDKAAPVNESESLPKKLNARLTPTDSLREQLTKEALAVINLAPLTDMVSPELQLPRGIPLTPAIIERTGANAPRADSSCLKVAETPALQSEAVTATPPPICLPAPLPRPPTTQPKQTPPKELAIPSVLSAAELQAIHVIVHSVGVTQLGAAVQGIMQHAALPRSALMAAQLMSHSTQHKAQNLTQPAASKNH